jgi:4-diphosphocytidyl-2-C-methyl-D-erythritol kinase
MDTWILPSPAKLNLFLHILGRRADGYHHLQTVFQFIDLCDELRFKQRDDGKILLTVTTSQQNETNENLRLDTIPVSDNLITQAALLLQQTSKARYGAHIELTKNIPIGGGLGGGSSNAATALIALNQLWQKNLSSTELAALGLQLGADVPIFVHGLAAWAEGIGEQFCSIKLPEPWYVLIIPPCQVATAKIFSDSELTRNTPTITIAEFQIQGGHNDCETVARKHYPIIGQALDWLGQHASAKMTGTGSCVYAAFATKTAALKIAGQVPYPLKGTVVRGHNVSPLHIALNI